MTESPLAVAVDEASACAVTCAELALAPAFDDKADWRTSYPEGAWDCAAAEAEVAAVAEPDANAELRIA